MSSPKTKLPKLSAKRASGYYSDYQSDYGDEEYEESEGVEEDYIE
jgi:hypothetical protein